MFLIAYDIACPRRRGRVARRLEKHALRCQKSVFIFRGDHPALTRLLAQIAPLLKTTEDCVQAWRLAADEAPHGRVCGTHFHITPPALVLSTNKPYLPETDAAYRLD